MAQRQGIAPEVHFTINGNEYDMGYYLADGLYPEMGSICENIQTASR
jgi:hypothetical protein